MKATFVKLQIDANTVRFNLYQKGEEMVEENFYHTNLIPWNEMKW